MDACVEVLFFLYVFVVTREGPLRKKSMEYVYIRLTLLVSVRTHRHNMRALIVYRVVIVGVATRRVF